MARAASDVDVLVDFEGPADSRRYFGVQFYLEDLLGAGDLITTFASILTVGGLAFLPFWDRRNQTLWEKLSNTHVVVDPFDARRPTPAPPS